MQPLVSIILPTYNGARYLRTSINSCLEQTYTHFELIIVNDCSTDDTLAIAEAYRQKDSRIRIINNEVNKKLPRSLNAGFEAAKGELYTWTSDDNYYAPTALQTMVDVLTTDSQIDLVYAGYTYINDNDETTGTKDFGDINHSFVKWDGCGACFLYRKQVHERNKGYDPSTFLIEDYDFFLRAFLHSRFLYLNRADLYFYRLHDASLTGTMATAVFDIQKIMLEKRIPTLLPILSNHDKMLLNRKFLVYYAVFKNHPAKAAYYLQQLFSFSKSQALLSIGYIGVKKMGQWFQIFFTLIFNFFKLLITRS